MTWSEKKTLDGAVYYYESNSKIVTWDKPEELMTKQELEDGKSLNWTWVPHPTDFWQPGRIIETNDAGTVVKTESGETVTVPKSGKMQDKFTGGRVQEVPLWPLKKSELVHLEEDLIMIENVNDGSIIHNLKNRYAQKELYTFVGASHRILVSINPYQRFPLYGQDQITKHREKSPNVDVPPHVFDIANDSYDEMLFEGKHQSILISGESGAGKTEATKQCLKFWAKVAGSKNGVEDRLIQANPVLEAFGNAKTIRNNNSSRFGKWQEVYFDQLARSIDGALIINYLLEKSRLVFQQAGERNFHIFYQLMNDSEMKSKYELLGPEENRFTMKGLTAPVEGIDDANDFKDARQAMRDLDFAPEEQEWLLRLPAAILHLGNVTFESEAQANNVRGSRIANNKPLKALGVAARLLGVSDVALSKVLLNRTIVVKGETNVIPLDPSNARAACDSIAKGIYGRMFDWLVQRCNQSLKGDTSGKFIGVLDIFGFEIFDVNSFEQLCINFCNEKLQQLFNKETFKDEEELYTREAIKFDPIKFIDSDPVLAMIEKPPNGILPALDDECKLPEGDDTKFMAKIEESFSHHPNFATDKHRKLNNQLAFEIIHYAGTVKYTADEFMVKNRDQFYQDAYDLLAGSSDALTKALFPPLDARIQTRSLSSVFRQQLGVLMNKLNTTSTRYVRCIKPNDSMAPLLFEAPLVLRQLRYSGVFEAVSIRKQGYPFRQTFEAFAFRYRAIHPDHPYRANDPRSVCEEILAATPAPPGENFASGFIFGKTMLFYRAPEYKTLKLLRNLCLETIIPRVQGILRGASARAIRRRIASLESGIDKALAARNDYDAMKAAVKAVDTVLGSLGSRIYPKYRPRNEEKGKKHLADLELWQAEEANLEAVLKTDPNANYPKYWAAKEAAERLSHIPASARQMELLESVRTAIASCEVGKLDNKLHAARKVMDRAGMEEGVAKAKEFNHDSPPVREAQRVLGLGERAWLELEVVAGQETNDAPRVKRCKLRLWEIDMSELPSTYLKWQGYAGLKAGEEYAKGKWFGKSACVQGMLVADKAVVNSSLTKSDDPMFKKLAKDINKGVLAYVGLKSDPRGAESAAVEILLAAARSPQAKNELFCQLLKASTPNEPKVDAASCAKAVDLLGVALYCFAVPDEELAKYVFMTGVKRGGKRIAAAASHGRFDATGGPRSGSDISRILSEIGSMGADGKAVAVQ